MTPSTLAEDYTACFEMLTGRTGFNGKAWAFVMTHSALGLGPIPKLHPVPVWPL